MAKKFSSYPQAFHYKKHNRTTHLTISQTNMLTELATALYCEKMVNSAVNKCMQSQQYFNEAILTIIQALTKEPKESKNYQHALVACTLLENLYHNGLLMGVFKNKFSASQIEQLEASFQYRANMSMKEFLVESIKFTPTSRLILSA